jgi:hypothetical protein
VNTGSDKPPLALAHLSSSPCLRRVVGAYVISLSGTDRTRAVTR